MDQFRGEVQHERQVAAACSALATACNASLVDGDAQVAAQGRVPAFGESWQWMRDAMTDAAKAPEKDRRAAMDAVESRLDEMQVETDATPDDGDFQKVHAHAAAVLARREFQGESGPTWWDRQKARFWGFVAKIFTGVQDIGGKHKWLWPFFEVLLYTAAAVGVVVLVRRSFVRQRQAIALGAGAAKASAWDKEAEDWNSQAERCAAKHEWREAVHCLYWAAIVGLEARRAWRHNPTRTPREYVRLLKTGSAQQASLRGLTQLLERVWYGLRDATREDYDDARSFYDGLHAAPRTEAA